MKEKKMRFKSSAFNNVKDEALSKYYPRLAHKSFKCETQNIRKRVLLWTDVSVPIVLTFLRELSRQVNDDNILF